MINSKTQLINILGAAVAHQSTKITVRNLDKDVINCLYKYGIVKGVSTKSNKYIIYINSEVCGKWKLIPYWRRHSRLYFRPINITKHKLHLQESIYIFSTSRGLISQHEMLQYNCGGVLAFALLLK